MDDNPESAFVAMAKGIYDEIDQKSLARMDVMRKDMEASLTTVLTKAMDQVYGVRLKHLEEELRHTKELNTHLLAFVKALPTPQIVVPGEAIKLLLPDRPEDNKTLQKFKTLETEIASLKSMHHDGQIRIEQMLKSLPTPQVVLPAEAIKVVVTEKPRKVEKSVLYGPSGRAEKIIETSE